MKIAVNVEAIGAGRGGAEKYAASLVRTLANAGHHVRVVARDADTAEFPPSVRVERVRLLPLPGCGWLRAWRFAAASERLLARAKCDLIIGLSKVWRQDVMIAVSGAAPASLAANSRRFRGTAARALWWASKLVNPKQWVFRAIERRQFRDARPHVVVPSLGVAEAFQRCHAVAPERISIIPWGLEDHRAQVPQHARADLRARLSLGPDDVAVLFVARNYALKGLDPLLEAMSLLVKRSPQVRLLVCGSLRDRPQRRRARRLGLERVVHFLGPVADVGACFAAADVFTLPTFYDPMSLVVLEAMRAGLPVVTTRANGAADLMAEGRDGFVIDDAWNVAALADRLGRLAASAELRRSFGEHARSAAAAYTAERHTAQLLEAIGRAANGIDPRSRRSAA